VVESATFADDRCCYVLRESVIVFSMAVALVLRQVEALFLVAAKDLAFLWKTNAGCPLFELVGPSCYEEGNFHP
jgi:hypothetical protein